MTDTKAVSLDQLSSNQKDALITLLTDDDAAIYHTVRSKILSYGPGAAQWLRPHAISSDPVLRRRAIEIIQYLAKQLADNHFLAFCLNQGEDMDVEDGSLLLAKTQYPDVNIAAYKALLDSYAVDLRERIDFASNSHSILATLNQFLFAERGFTGNEQNYDDPDNSYLNRVMDLRTGNPISLCIVFLGLARRLRLPITGIGMPGHFVCRYQSTTEEIFIDPFNKGKLLSKGDCIKYLVHTTEGFKESYLAPVTGRRMILRVCANLHQIYLGLGMSDEVARFHRYIVALAK